MRKVVSANAYSIESPSEVWRISQRRYGLMTPPPRFAQGGGRFDDPHGSEPGVGADYSTLYVSVTAYGAFLETLPQFRPRIGIRQEIASEVLMDVDQRDALVEETSGISEDWIAGSHLTHAQITTIAPVFDLANPAAVQYVRDALAPAIYALGISDLDFGHVMGGDRRLTRAIGRWLWSLTNDAGEPMFAGIRYRSRFDPESVCLVLYEDRFAVAGAVETFPISTDTPGFDRAAEALQLLIR